MGNGFGKFLSGAFICLSLLDSCDISKKGSDKIIESGFERFYRVDDSKFKISYPRVNSWTGVYSNNLVLNEKGVKYNFTLPKNNNLYSFDGSLDNYAKIFALKSSENENFYNYVEKREKSFLDSPLISYLTSINFKKESYNANNNPSSFNFLKRRADSVLKKIYLLDSIDFVNNANQARLDSLVNKQNNFEKVKDFLSN